MASQWSFHQIIPKCSDWLVDKIINFDSRITVYTERWKLHLSSLEFFWIWPFHFYSNRWRYKLHLINIWILIQFSMFWSGPPQWQSKPTDLRVGPREKFNIKCSGIGHPDPSVLWRKQIGLFIRQTNWFDLIPVYLIGSEWQDLFESTGIFTKISSTEISGHQLVKERDEGKYGCEITNGINPSLWTEFMIKISGKIFSNL